jgi:deoxyribonuclease V
MSVSTTLSTARREAPADPLQRPAWPSPAPPWPRSAEELLAVQDELARATMAPWPTPAHVGRVAACFVCFERGRTGPGIAGDRGRAAACLAGVEGEPPTSIARGLAEARCEPGLLAMREGPLLEAALRSLPAAPDLLMVNATGRDHQRRAGLAQHLGARLGLPSIGVTNRPLLATGASPDDRRGATSPLRIGDEIVASWVRTRSGMRPLVAGGDGDHGRGPGRCGRSRRAHLEAAHRSRAASPPRASREGTGGATRKRR